MRIWPCSSSTRRYRIVCTRSACSRTTLRPGGGHAAGPCKLAGRTGDATLLGGQVRGLVGDGGKSALELFDPSLAAGAPLNPHGASGGPVLAEDTEVAIGVLRRISSVDGGPAIGGLVYAIPARTVIDHWGERLAVANPFQRPLQRFDGEDAERYFGRENALGSLQAAVEAPGTRVVTVLGAPGSGKSSLVRAGSLAHDPKSSRVVEAYGDPAVIVAEPGSLIVLDQFERLYHEPGADAVAERISGLVRETRGLIAIIVMRTDYLALFEARFPGLYALLIEGLSGVKIRLEVSREELVAICEGPAHAGGIPVRAGPREPHRR